LLQKGVNITTSLEVIQGDCETKFIEVYVDLNQNNSFEITEKVGFVPSPTIDANCQATTPQTYNFTILIPTTATNGLTRLRVIYKGGNGLPADVPCPNGLSYGEIEDYRVSITTTPTPAAPWVSTLPATNIGSNQATLNGSVNANYGPTATISFEYGTTTAYGSTANATPTTTSGTVLTNAIATLTGLTANTTYHYRTKATVGANTYYGSDITFTTFGIGDPVISNVGYTTTTSGTPYDPFFFGALVNPNSSTGVNVFFEYGFTTAYGTTVAATPAVISGFSNVSITYTFQPQPVYTFYHWRVKVVKNGVSYYSPDQLLQYFNGPIINPVPATSITGTTATLNGSVRPDNIGFGINTNVKFEYGLTTNYGNNVVATPSSFPPPTTSEFFAVSTIISGLTINTTYHYRVRTESISIGNVYRTHVGPDSTFTTNSLGTIDFNEDLFEVFPNPTNSIINIKTKTGLELDKINIYNIEGKLIYSQVSNLTNVNLQNLSSGTYLIQAFSGDKIVTKKIIKN
ncbi:GEVED domain-containing protein, partial [Flavobacterium sp.]|uniref:GEVED domain-containing protein n=1 Tax=Flavobacterium sp. TaxID=239 RepID=UPI00391C412B